MIAAISKPVWLFLGIAAVLLVATAVSEVLRWRLHGRSSSVVDNLVARIRAWWVMALVVGIAFALGRIGVIVLFALVSLFALREFITLAPTRRGDYYALLVAFYVVLPWQYWLVYIDWYGMYTLLIPVYAFLLLPILSTAGGDTTRYLERTAKVQWGLMICVFCISHVPALLNLKLRGYEGSNLLLIAFLVIVVQSSDVLQYIWGKLAGRRLVAPRLSPSKTVEGFVGGVLSATALGAALWWITPFTPWQAAALALVANLMGFYGGLVMSAIKRDRGIKDWGHMIEGHGGVLDRLDSVCFAAPVFFHLIRYFWKG
ncbi:phosphatidate cytidylyltransferase [Montanilutibacter psychrotolerans]|uniref:Phosphatidate cytidylyltransferase n=1 Tax=Montanilutibacter psychrotolerans TaxID=1327343 RepID=A0A3M8SLK5_9GAMM|nr:phosphatidate cytidylyltransferase [Lysobacter psychrotolerans]RNF82257.1 phosphatidate cytidylyltransferase [Lysobacter psychrotolerans]